MKSNPDNHSRSEIMLAKMAALTFFLLLLGTTTIGVKSCVKNKAIAAKVQNVR